MVTVLPTVFLYPNLALNVVGLSSVTHEKSGNTPSRAAWAGAATTAKAPRGSEQRQDESQDPRAGTHADNPERELAALFTFSAGLATVGTCRP